MGLEIRSYGTSKEPEPRAHLHGRHAACLSKNGGAIEDGGHDAVEVPDDGRAVCVPQLFRNHSPAQAHARESCVLAETASLDCHLLRTFTELDIGPGFC